MSWSATTTVGTRVLLALLVAAAASCANSPTVPESAVDASIVQTLGHTDFSLEIRLTNREAYPVWIPNCYGVQRRDGTSWVDDAHLGSACASTPPTLLDPNSSITRFVLLRRSALGEDLTGEWFRVLFPVLLTEGWGGPGGPHAATRAFSLDD